MNMTSPSYRNVPPFFVSEYIYINTKIGPIVFLSGFLCTPPPPSIATHYFLLTALDFRCLKEKRNLTVAVHERVVF